MTLVRRNINSDTKESAMQQEAKHVKVGNYQCTTTNTPNLFKIEREQGGYVARCNYGRTEKIDKKTGTIKAINEVTLKVVKTVSEGKELLHEAEEIRRKKKSGNLAPTVSATSKITLDSAIEEFKKDQFYKDLSENYQRHYDNYLKHISDYMGQLNPADVKVSRIEGYYDYQLHRGNMSTAKKNKDGSINKHFVSESNPEGISINTLSKHKTALKNLWKFMIKKECYGVDINYPVLTEIPKVDVEVDGKIIKTRKIAPKRTPLTLDELNYTLNDAIQNEADRSIALLIALGSIGGLRRGEVGALKIGRYYHDHRMQTGEEMWSLNDFQKIRSYYEEHDELILIDESIVHNSKDTLEFPKNGIIRMAGKANVLNDIVEYAMEQRQQVANTMGYKIKNDDRLYLPLINVISNSEYSVEKITRKWREYQGRRNKRMIEAGLEPIPVIRFHDLRHTCATLLNEGGVPVMEISKHLGHVIAGEGQINNTTTKVYIHDRKPVRDNVIQYWDSHINIDWEKSMRVNLNDENNRAHINGSGHLVIQNEDKKRIMQLRKRFVLTEEEMAELLFSEEAEDNIIEK